MGKPYKVLVTGANGQLGQELVRLQVPNSVEITGFGRDTLDIADMDNCRRVFLAEQPNAVIHCAAYTAVDKAESEFDEAYRINASGTRNVAVAAGEVGAKFCYISTDYVFSGNGNSPYVGYDRADPQTVYGKSKLAGELLTQTLSNKYFIVRTSWVFGRYGSNFVNTMLNLANKSDTLKIVHDQVGSPTYTLDLAQFLIQLVQTEKYGIYHASNTGGCSWFEFAEAIFRIGGVQVAVEPCETKDFPRPAPRPAYSVMDHSAIRSNGFQQLRPWEEALQHYLGEIEN